MGRQGALGKELMMSHCGEKLARQVALFKRMGMFDPDDRSVRVRRAVTEADLRAAYELVHEVYLEKGYITEKPGRIRLRVFEAFPEMATFLCEKDGQIAAVMSIVPDSVDAGLPSDAAFGEELDAVRRQGRKLAEITNLAVKTEFRRSNAFPELTRAVYAQAVASGMDDIFIAISQGHGSFFQGVLQFDPCGDQRSYSDEKEDIVEGKRMDLHTIEQRWQEVDAALGKDAFLYAYYGSGNPFHGYVRPWSVIARRVLLDVDVLWRLFVRQSHMLARCTDQERDSIRRRWGDVIFRAVYEQEMAELALA